jgi:hypothetical protein
MLAATSLVASGVCRGVAMYARLSNGAALRQGWTAALAITGVLLMASTRAPG